MGSQRRRAWHLVRIRPRGMGTLLLVGEEAKTESPSQTGATTSRRRPLTNALQRVGYNVVQADDAAGVLARLGAVPPDLILVAGAVPDMELLDLCAALRRDAAGEKTPFVLVAGATAQTGSAASRTGADLVFPPSVGPVERSPIVFGASFSVATARKRSRQESAPIVPAGAR
jgi:PleD family two-component response regulator